MQSSAKTKPAVVTQHLNDAGRGINLLVSLPIQGRKKLSLTRSISQVCPKGLL